MKGRVGVAHTEKEKQGDRQITANTLATILSFDIGEWRGWFFLGWCLDVATHGPFEITRHAVVVCVCVYIYVLYRMYVAV